MRRIWLCLCVLLGCCAREPAPPRASGGSAPAAEAARVTRMVVRSANLELRSSEPRQIADRAAEVAAAVGGYVLSSELRADGENVSEVAVELRVPEASFEATLRRLRGLGTVLQENVQGQDVSEEFVDVSARLQARRTLEARLLSLVTSSSQLKDVLLVEEQLARVRSEIEQHEGRARFLQERTSMAGIALVVQAPAASMLGTRMSKAARNAGELAITICELMIQALGFVLALAPLGLAIFGVRRWLRRRRIVHAPAGGAV